MNEKDEEIINNIKKIDNKPILPTLTNQIKNDYNFQSKISSESAGSDPSSRTKSFLSMDDTISKIKHLKNKFNSLIIKLDYRVKNYIFVASLLMTSCLNYNFLYLPYIFLGFILSFFLIPKNKKKYKNIYLFIRKSEFYIMIYSALLLIFKIIIINLIRIENSFIEEKKNLFINLGIQVLKDKNSDFNLISTFIGEIMIFFVSLIFSKISTIYMEYDLFVINDEFNLKGKKFWHLIKKNLIISYFMILGLAVFNISLISLFYIFIMNILLFFISKHSNIKTVSYIFRIFIGIFYYLIMIQIFLINVLNIYHFDDLLTSQVLQIEKGEKYYSKFTIIGINIMTNNENKYNIYFHVLSYFFTVLSLVSLAINKSKITFKNIKLQNSNVYDSEDEKEEKLINPEDDIFEENGRNENENEKKEIIKEESKLKKFFINLKKYFKISHFILHICRVFAILWINEFRNFFSIIIFIWLFFSFLFKNINDNKGLSMIMSFTILISLILFHFGNIDGFFENDKTVFSVIEAYHIGLSKFENKSIYYLFSNLFYFVINLFIYFLYENGEKEMLSQILNKKEFFPVLKNEENLLNSNEIQTENNKKLYDLNKPKEENKKLNFTNVIIKTLLSHIDMITYIIMYFISIHSINIIHFVIIIIFMAQLLFPKIISFISKYLMAMLQLLLFSELILDILNHYFNDYFIKNDKLIKLMMEYDVFSSNNSIEIWIYLIVYCFYFKYQLLNNDSYKNIIFDKNINLPNYIKMKVPNLYVIGEIILKLYILLLISLFIFFDSYFELNILFEIKLFLFFIVVFKFLSYINNSDKKSFSMVSNWIFLIYSSLNTILVYGYQIICMKYFDIDESSNFFTKNLPSIGFSEYKGDLYYKFMPHLFCNFISILYKWEMERIIKSNAAQNLKKDIQKNEKKADKEKEKEIYIGFAQKYKMEKEKNLLKIKYIFLTIILFITNSYGLFLFFTICIIFTAYDLSILAILYLIVFGIVFILKFYKIIEKLNNYLQKESFFFSRLIRYKYIEKKMHVGENTIYRRMAFKYLLCLSMSSILLYYFYGIFYLVQHGCDVNKWKSCDNRHQKMIPYERKEGENIIDEIFIQSISYLFGFYINSNEDSIIKVGWAHIFFFLLICGDVYAQQLDNYFNNKIKLNRKQYKEISFKLKKRKNDEENNGNQIKRSFSFRKKQTSIDDIYDKNSINTNESNNKEIEQNLGNFVDEIGADIKNKNNIIPKEDEIRGKRLIYKFLNIFEQNIDDIKLSQKSKFYPIVRVIKKLFEEIIIFFLICTSISKMNIWSFIYMIISIFLIITNKSMKKYYYLFCFMIFSIFIQIFIFIFNLHVNTDPRPKIYILNNITERFNIPLYKFFGINEKKAYFFGLGISSYQIYLIWMEFIEVVIIYIYLEYFSYSIYYKKNRIGRFKDNLSKINYKNLFSNNKTKEISLKLSKDEYEEHKNCMKYNFNIDILEYKEFKYFMKNGKPLPKPISETNNLNNIINKEKRDIEKHDNFQEERKEFDLNLKPLSKTEIRKKKNFNSFGSNKGEEKRSELYFSALKDFIFLSFHNIILIIIIVISMMISGFISIIYIVCSLVFLITSTSIYLGKKYYYPKAIKTVLRVIILIDITAQIIYQSPYFDGGNIKDLLENIGLNKIIIFEKQEGENGQIIYNYDISKNNLFLVFAKAFIHLFMSIQILIYSSQTFQEYYLSYIITRNNTLGKTTLINIFKFNNERIQTMKKSIVERNEMFRSLNNLNYKLENFNPNSIKKDDNYINSQSEINKQNIENLEKEKKENNLSNKLDNQEEEKWIKFVRESIKNIILDGFLIQLHIKIHRNAADYTSIINEDEKIIYKKDIIQGKTKIMTFIEKQTENELNKFNKSNKSNDSNEPNESNILNFSEFTNEDLKYFKGIFKELTKGDNKKNKKESNKFHNKGGPKVDEQKKIKIESMVKQLISSELFIKYLQKSYIIKSIMMDIVYFCLNYFYWVCFFVMIINHIMNSSLISLFYPISIFCFAIFEYPRPKKSFWFVCLTYTIIIIAGKFVINLGILRENENFKNFILNLYRNKIGLKICESTFSIDFLIYILYDALVLVVLLLNNYLLVSKGMWIDREQNIETIYQAMERIAINEDEYINEYDIDEIKSFVDKYLDYSKRKKKVEKEGENENSEYLRFNEQSPIENLYTKLFKKTIKNKNEKNKKEEEKNKNEEENIIKLLAKKDSIEIKEKEILEKKRKKQKKKDSIYDEKKRNYFQRLFPTIRNEKPGDDYYVSYSILMLTISAFIIFFYTTMVQDKTFGSVELNTKQFSGEMVVVLLIHVIILVYERILYISQNTNNLKSKYILYDKLTKAPLTDKEFDEFIKDNHIQLDKGSITPEDKDKIRKTHKIIYIQTEGLNLPSVQKYILQIILVFSTHIFLFFYCPIKGNMNAFNIIYCPERDEKPEETDYINSKKECNDFLNNNALIIFYLLYIAYFVCSGLQIKYGFYDIKRKSVLKSGKSWINGSIYNTFKAIPFIYEIKLAIDWTFTKTALDFFQWNKFESVYDAVYCDYCAMNAKNKQKVGQKIGKMLKILMGGALTFSLVFILVTPLILFSSLNPTNKINNLTGASLKIDLGFFYENGVIKNYTLFENSKPENIENMVGGSFDYLKYNYSQSPKTKNFPLEQVQTVKFFEESDKNWDLTYPHISNLRELIINRANITGLKSIGLIFDYNFQRPLPAESMTITKRFTYEIYNNLNHSQEQDEILDELGEALYNCNNAEVEFNNVYSPPIRLSATTIPKRILDDKYFLNLDIRLGFVCVKDQNNGYKNRTKINYFGSYFTAKKIMKDSNGHIDIGGIVFHVFSDQVSTTTSGKTILTFYVSFVLLAGTYIRNFFAGKPEKIILTEMPHVEEIINLCEGVRLARYMYDFEQEEKLYYVLIELMRSPDYLRTLTKSSTEQFKERKELSKTYETSNNFKI